MILSRWSDPRRRPQLDKALNAIDVTLTPSDLAPIEQAIPQRAAPGDRYAPARMAMLDNERAS